MLQKVTAKPSAAAKSRCSSRCTTRATLVAAAHDLIWANSYAHVSVEDICRKAGVQKGSFYHFFPTKADLAAAALEDHWQQTKPKLDAIFAGHLTPQQQLRALCREILEKQRTALESTGLVCGCPYATVGAEMRGSNEALTALTEQLNEHFCGYFEKLLAHAARDGLIARTGLKQRAREMHVYVIGAMLQARMMNSLDSVGKSLEVALLRMSGMGKQR